MSKQLQNNFNTIYKEWKEYNTFFHQYIKSKEDSVKDKIKDILDNPEDSEKILEYFYDTQSYPQMYKADLNLLSLKLVTTYNAVKDDIEVSEEIRKEVEELDKSQKSPQRFIVRAGKAEAINQEDIDRTMKLMRENIKVTGVLDNFRKQLEEINKDN